MPKELVLDFCVDNFKAKEPGVALLQAAVKEGPCRWLACINPHSYAVSINDANFASALRSADWLVPDGIGFVFGARLLGSDIRDRVTGSDVFASVMRAADEMGTLRVFFLGSTESNLEKIRRRLEHDYQNVTFAGYYSPPFTSEFSAAENESIIQAINASRADILWVGLTAPKQEKWLWENSARLNVRFAGAIGAVFDFYAGNVRRPSPLIRLCHLEWLFRLVQEPRRLWRRTVISLPIFFSHVLQRLLTRTVFYRRQK